MIQSMAGAVGPTGATGAAGAAGAAGSNGSNGTNGADGNTILSGAGAPSDALGVNGNFYFDTTSQIFYGPKASGTWTGTGKRFISVAPFLKPEFFSNGGNNSVASTAGLVQLEAINLPYNFRATGINFVCGATATGGTGYVGLYGGSLSGGLYSGVATPGTVDGSTLIAVSASTTNASLSAVTNRGSTIPFTSSIDLAGGQQFWLALEGDGASFTFDRCVNGGVGPDYSKTFARGGGYGSPTTPCPATTAWAYNNAPMMQLVGTAIP